MKVYNGEGAVLGRISGIVAKESLKGEEIAIVNCDKIIITGGKENIKREYKIKRSRVGSSQKGPKISRRSDLIVKRAIRGMLPNYREGRGREAFKRIRCYVGIPKELEGKEIINPEGKKRKRVVSIREISK